MRKSSANAWTLGSALGSMPKRRLMISMPSLVFLVAIFDLILTHISLGIPTIESQSRYGKVYFRIRHKRLLGDSVRHKDQIFADKAVEHSVVDAADSCSQLIHSVTQHVRVWSAKLMPKLPKQVQHEQALLK